MHTQISQIKNSSLAPMGIKKIEWVERFMPIVTAIKKDFEKTKPFEGLNITICIHMEAKTAYLATVLKAAGANVTVTGCNPLSTQDEIAAGLVEKGLTVFGWYNATEKEYFEHLHLALAQEPDIILDDGGDLIQILHSEKQDLLQKLRGGCEETTTGVIRLRAREKAGQLNTPMISVNDAYCKYLFDNRYGTGQSVWDGIMRTTNLIVCGKTVVIAGYGWCGKGAALRAKGLGAKVVVCEVDPIKAIEAMMDGHQVMTMDEASKIGDLFITVTGCEGVITKKHFEQMKNGAILSNAGHFDVEICIPELAELSVEKKDMRPNIEGYVMPDGREIYLLAQGRLVNLAAGDGHAAEIMDMSFGIQLLSLEYMAKNYQQLENKVYEVPAEIDQKVAALKLSSMGISIDQLTEHQKAYLEGFVE